eukprot:TRINITY_DN4509_c0_g1_i7.p1 TRINITY_DN4509_c0_g1~~TRINITY_DN4509_c0_g1_i7.p1  ORF type:complete len:191 (+),score=29.82 TRINITY_DN4509_c0_g1_i7:68-574(+)
MCIRDSMGDYYLFHLQKVIQRSFEKHRKRTTKMETPLKTSELNGNRLITPGNAKAKIKSSDVAKSLGLTSDRFESSHMSERADQLLCKAKKKHRTDIKAEDWDKYKYYETDWCERLLNECPDQIDRINADDVSCEEFIEKYERIGKPCVIKGITKTWNTDRYLSLIHI